MASNSFPDLINPHKPNQNSGTKCGISNQRKIQFTFEAILPCSALIVANNQFKKIQAKW